MSEQPFLVDQAALLRRMVTGEQAIPPSVTPTILSVMAGKGGVGKSTIALNLALAATERVSNVLLVDADPNLGNLDIMLGESPRYRLGHILRDEVDIDDALFSPFPGLHMLAGSSGDQEYPAFSAERYERLFDGLAATETHSDLVVIDTGAGLNRENIECALHSDEVLVVSTVEPSAILDAYALIKTVTASRSDIPLSILMNQVRSPRDADEGAGKLIQAVRRFLGVTPRYAGYIPWDEKVGMAIMSQSPLLVQSPRTAASLSMQSIAAGILDHRTHHKIGKRMVPA